MNPADAVPTFQALIAFMAAEQGIDMRQEGCSTLQQVGLAAEPAPLPSPTKTPLEVAQTMLDVGHALNAWDIPAFRSIMNACVSRVMPDGNSRERVRLTPHVEIVAEQDWLHDWEEPICVLDTYLHVPHPFTLENGQPGVWRSPEFGSLTIHSGEIFAQAWAIHDAVEADLISKAAGGSGVLPDALQEATLQRQASRSQPQWDGLDDFPPELESAHQFI